MNLLVLLVLSQVVAPAQSHGRLLVQDDALLERLTQLSEYRRDNLECMVKLNETERQLTMQRAECSELDKAAAVVIGLGVFALCLAWAFMRLDKIVAAWRRSELPRLPWATIALYAVIIGGEVVAHWVMR